MPEKKVPDSAVPKPLPAAEWPASLDEVLADMKGKPINVHGLMAHHPELLRAWWRFRNHTVKGGTLPERERELVILTVARHMRNDYEWQSHVDRGLAAGLTEEEIERVRTGTGGWTAKDAVLLEGVHGLLTDHAVSGECLARMRQLFTLDQVMDVIFIHGAYVILGCLLNTFDVPIDTLRWIIDHAETITPRNIERLHVKFNLVRAFLAFVRRNPHPDRHRPEQRRHSLRHRRQCQRGRGCRCGCQRRRHHQPRHDREFDDRQSGTDGRGDDADR